MLIILVVGCLLFLLMMSLVNEDLIWLQPLFFDSNFSMVETTFDYQVPRSSFSASSNMSSIPMSILTSTASSVANQDPFPVLKWSVRIIGGLLIVVGGIGNTLSALTLSRKKLRAQVTSIYLIALALSDLGKAIPPIYYFGYNDHLLR